RHRDGKEQEQQGARMKDHVVGIGGQGHPPGKVGVPERKVAGAENRRGIEPGGIGVEAYIPKVEDSLTEDDRMKEQRDRGDEKEKGDSAAGDPARRRWRNAHQRIPTGRTLPSGPGPPSGCTSWRSSGRIGSSSPAAPRRGSGPRWCGPGPPT